MSRYTGPVCRLCRREGEKLFLKTERCYTERCPVEKRPYPPGEAGRRGTRRKVSEYGTQLREKQKAKRIFGIGEKQFHGYYKRAVKARKVTGEELLRLLERRLDNVFYRLGFAGTRSEARQLVRHGHVQVNGRKVNIPSYLVAEGDTVEVRQGSKSLDRFKELAENTRVTVPEWLEADWDNLRGVVKRFPTREDIDVSVREHLVVELYSR